jgi:hypothetical protein
MLPSFLTVREVSLFLAHFVGLIGGGDDNEGAMVDRFFPFSCVCFLERMESTLPAAVQETEKQLLFCDLYCSGERWSYEEAASSMQNFIENPEIVWSENHVEL